MNSKQQVDVINYLGVLWGSSVLQGRHKISISPDETRTPGGHFPYAPFEAEEVEPPPPKEGGEEVEMKEEPKEEEKISVDVCIFKDGIRFYKDHSIFPNLTPINETQRQMRLRTPTLTWTGSPNCYDHSDFGKTAVKMDHFRRPERMAQWFKKGVPISLADVMSSVPPDRLFHKNDQTHDSEEWIKYKKLIPEGKVAGYFCCCHNSPPDNVTKVYDFGQVYVHGLTLEVLESTYPFPVGLKVNCVNNDDAAEGDEFYRNFLAIRNPPSKPTAPSQGESEVPPPQKVKTNALNFNQPYNSHNWTAAMGGLQLEPEQVLNRDHGAGHLPNPLMAGLIRLPNEVVRRHASAERKAFFEKETFHFIPAEHTIYFYFMDILAILDDRTIHPTTRRLMLRTKKPETLFYQLIKFPLLDISNHHPETTESNSSSSASIDGIYNTAAKIAQEHLQIGHGVVMAQGTIVDLIGWMLQERQQTRLFKRPIALEEISLVLFRTDTKDHSWLVHSDFHPEPKFDPNSDQYRFSVKAHFFLSVMPAGMHCSKSHVSTNTLMVSIPVEKEEGEEKKGEA